MGWLVSSDILRLFRMGSNVSVETEVAGSSTLQVPPLFAITFSPHRLCAAEERKFRKRRTGPTFDDLLRLTEQGDPKAEEAIRQMGEYLGRGIALLVTGLAPDVIVVIGEVTRAWNLIGPVIDAAVKRHSFTRAGTRVVPADPTSQPRLRGTIALVLQKHFGAPSVA